MVGNLTINVEITTPLNFPVYSLILPIEVIIFLLFGKAYFTVLKSMTGVLLN